MMGYYDNQKDYDARGIDSDLCYAIEYNSCEFDVVEIEHVLAIIEGENDGNSWHWVVELKNGTYGYATGGCDYTGWDCRSWLESYVNVNLDEVLRHADSPTYHGNYNELKRQIDEERAKPTWRQTTNQEFSGVLYGVDLEKIKQNVALSKTILQEIPSLPPVVEPLPQYEVFSAPVYDAMVIVPGLLREKIWFCVRPVDSGESEIVVRYEDRERLFFYAGVA